MISNEWARLHFRLASQTESYIIPQYQIKTAVNNCVEELSSSIQEAKGVSATKYHPHGRLHQFKIKYAHKNYKSVVCSCHMLIKWFHLWIMCENKSHRLLECWPHNHSKCSEPLAQHSATSHIPCIFSNTAAWTSNLFPKLHLFLHRNKKIYFLNKHKLNFKKICCLYWLLIHMSLKQFYHHFSCNWTVTIIRQLCKYFPFWTSVIVDIRWLTVKICATG